MVRVPRREAEGVSIQLSSHDKFVSALENAHHVSIASYSLTQEMVDRLKACTKHADVHVRLDGKVVGRDRGSRADTAKRMVQDLCENGVDAYLVPPSDDIIPHAKAAIVDDVLWLDDRNFPRRGYDLTVRDDDPADVVAGANAMAGHPARTARLTFIKCDAIHQEAAAIAAAPRGEIALSTEDISTGAIVNELKDRLAAGDGVRLIVNAHECTSQFAREALATLKGAGADIRSGRELDKLTLTPDRVWLGSTNATGLTNDTAGQSDWGLVTTNADAVVTLRGRFETEWRDAKKWTPRPEPRPLR